MYTIGEVSRMFDIPASTLRYYDKEGLFPGLSRQSGIRRFSDDEIELLRVIECLKKSGLEIRDIKQFVAWIEEGPSTYGLRKQMFETRAAAIEEEISRLERSLAMMRFKSWYYETALAHGNEDSLSDMIPDNLPKRAQELYDLAHSEV